MTTLTTRGRVAVVAGFVVSAGLCAGAAVALVKASDHSSTDQLLPQVHPTLVYPTGSPTATPSPSALSTPTATPTPSASVRPTPRATASSSPRATRAATHEPTTVPVPLGPAVDASLTPVTGQPGSVSLSVHATSDTGTLTLTSVNWDDGTVVHGADGTPCDAPQGGDCEDYRLAHTYAAGSYDVTVVVSDGSGSTTVVLHLQVS